MQYAKCVNNKTYVEGDLANTLEPELMVGNIYKLLPVSESERKGGMVRVIDGSRRASLYPSSYFKPVDVSQISSYATSSLSVHLPDLLRGILHAEALAAGTSMSGLVRKWIEERLDLPRS